MHIVRRECGALNRDFCSTFFTDFNELCVWLNALVQLAECLFSKHQELA